MAQESWKKEPEAPVMCVNKCGFFGSATMNNMCSKCYRDYVMATTVAPAAEKTTRTASSSTTPIEPAGQEKQPEQPAKPPANRCLSCRKKVGLTGFQCRCGGTFCSSHRYSDTHECSFDYKKTGREQIAKQNPVVMAAKITKI